VGIIHQEEECPALRQPQDTLKTCFMQELGFTTSKKATELVQEINRCGEEGAMSSFSPRSSEESAFQHRPANCSTRHLNPHASFPPEEKKMAEPI